MRGFILNSKEENTKTCPKCNEEQDINNLYCFNCGNKFTRFDGLTLLRCPNCSQFQDLKNNFCIHCGHELTEAPTVLFKCPQCEKEISIDAKFCPFCFFVIKQKKCPDCGQEQNEKNDICSSCGYDFVNDVSSQKLKECPQCAEKVTENSKACPKCGHDFIDKAMPKIKPPQVSKLLRFQRETIFLSNYDFNLKPCPKCNSKLLGDEKFCYSCGCDVENYEIPVQAPKQPRVSKLLKFQRETTFLSNYDFNLKQCPKCNSKLLWSDVFCYNCGEKVGSHDTVLPQSIPESEVKPKAEAPEESKAPISKTDYPAEFRIPLVLYLEDVRKNPKKEISNSILKKYGADLDKIKEQAIADEFIELESPLMVANSLKLTDIKKVLKEHNLKVSGKKEELIERLGESLTEEELNSHFKGEKYLITDKGLEFVNNNNYIIYIHKNSEVSEVIFPSEYVNIFDEREYPQDEIYVTLIDYFNGKFVNQLNEGKWDDFKSYSSAIASVLKDQGYLEDAMIMRFKVFLFDINNYSQELQKANPSQTKLKSNDIYKLYDTLAKLNKPPEEVMKLFATACGELMFKREISDEDSWKYFVEIIQGKELKEVSKEINEDYS